MTAHETRTGGSGGHDTAELRERVRTWIEAHVPADWQTTQAGVTHVEYLAFQRWWFDELKAGGYLNPHWPAEWGGGYSMLEQAVIFEELARADAPRLDLYLVSLHHVPSALLTQGTPEQIDRYLNGVLAGEVWCQGFSEPDAGSDLASLRTRAVRDGDQYIVNGQKVWTSRAPDADFCLLLARTNAEAPKRHGISYFMMDMRSPGVEVRPIHDALGWPHFAEVFLTDVAIPASNLIGEENGGWQLAQVTLSDERSMMILELTERLAGGLQRIVAAAATKTTDRGKPALDDDQVRQSIGKAASELEALRLMCQEILIELGETQRVPARSSIVKVYYSELLQRITSLAVDLEGLAGQVTRGLLMAGGWETGYWIADHLHSRRWMIGGGSNEIQRNVIATRILGLPRESSVA